MMAGVDYLDLPFWDRPDLSPYLIHLTKRKNELSAFENLVSILKDGIIKSSGNSGFIQGTSRASCFMGIPFSALKHLLTKENCNPQKPRYEPYGVFFTKKFGYEEGVRPVLYISKKEAKMLNIPDAEKWRIVTFQINKDQSWISWLHEREWRKKDDFELPTNAGVLVRTDNDAKKLYKMLYEEPDEYEIIPRIILPLVTICQGLKDKKKRTTAKR